MRGTCFVLICALVAWAPATHAQATPRRQTIVRRHPQRLLLPADIPVMVATGAWWGTSQLLLNRIVVGSCPCNAADVLPIDRWLAGHRNDTLATIADASVVVGLVGVAATVSFDVWGTRGEWREAFEDVAVIAESVLVSGALNQFVKLGVQRPRPMLYRRTADDPLLAEPDNYLSFYSAHTSTALAAGLSLAWVIARRHPNAWWRWIPYAGAATFGGAVGALRIASGRHFPTDVLFGALMGSVIGTVIPWLHERPNAPVVTIGAIGDGAGLVLAGGW